MKNFLAGILALTTLILGCICIYQILIAKGLSLWTEHIFPQLNFSLTWEQTGGLLVSFLLSLIIGGSGGLYYLFVFYQKMLDKVGNKKPLLK